ncbi:MAG: cyclase [Myxococcales bacterium]|mgnify:CR=1 FL=1|nr:cyclase [Myxococcales bacterium]|tara:strand:- start:120 stop:554 length:435 start_codon:yes stop_codon:yes gene_type:complete
MGVNSASQDIVINVPPSQFFDVIADYERYPEILPEMESARIIKREHGEVHAQFTFNLIKRVSYTLAMVETPPHRLEWRLVEGPLAKNSGSWQLTPMGDNQTLAEYSIDLSLGIFVPKAVINRFVVKTMPRLLNHFKYAADARDS